MRSPCSPTTTMARSPSPAVDGGTHGLLATFPRSPSQFNEDPRISYSQLDSKYILETEEGGEYEYDDKLRRWLPVVRFHLSLS